MSQPTESPAIRKAMIDFDAPTHDAIMALADSNGRTLRAEVLHAIERHLAAPPVVIVHVDVPPMPAATVSVPAKKPARRGRPRSK